MKIDKVLARFASNPGDERELKRVARALGSELPHQRIDHLRAFRARLAQITLSQDSYAEGYLTAMRDIVAEYEVYVRQAEDRQAARSRAMRKDWREVLRLLRTGPMLPSEIAQALDKDRASISRTLQKLRQAELLQSYASADLDGRTRPHRLTREGQKVAAELGAGLSDEFERGVALAVHLFQHLVANAVLPLPALEAVAGELVPDEDEASAATKVWLEAAVDAGLLSSLGDRYRLDAADVDVQRQEALWNSAASLLAQVKARNAPDVPVYVRTGDAWGAWAYALQTQAPSESRTIDNGDILSRSIETPKREFALVYEDPADIRVDRNEPAMQELWRKAGEKFVVSAPGDDDEEVPPDFVQLPLVPPDED